MFKNSLDIICIDDNLEALAIRSVLEYWQVKVNLYLIGKSQDLIDILKQQKSTSENILIMCHGDEKGICLPELVSEIAKTQPYDKHITAINLHEFLNISATTVINTGCKTGTTDFANAFLRNGCQNYIAPIDYPEGNASLFFIINFYYQLFVNNEDVKKAHQKAKSSDGNETDMFELFTK